MKSGIQHYFPFGFFTLVQDPHLVRFRGYFAVFTLGKKMKRTRCSHLILSALAVVVAGSTGMGMLLQSGGTAAAKFTVVGINDAPAANVIVQISQALTAADAPSGGGGGGGGGAAPAPRLSDGNGAIELQKSGPTVASARTDANGVVEFKSLPVGKLQYSAGVPVATSNVGYKKGPFETKQGQVTAVTVKLEAVKKRK